MALLTWCQSRIARQIRRNRRISNLARALILPPPNAHHGVHFKSRARVGFTTAECTQMVAFPVGVLAGLFSHPAKFPSDYSDRCGGRGSRSAHRGRRMRAFRRRLFSAGRGHMKSGHFTSGQLSLASFSRWMAGYRPIPVHASKGPRPQSFRLGPFAFWRLKYRPYRRCRPQG